MKDEPNPSWSAEKMTRYMEDKYAKHARFTEVPTGRQVPWSKLVRIFDKRKETKS